MKKFGIIVSVIISIIICIALYFWYTMGQPLYKPGNLSTRTDLKPPTQNADSNFWQVEENIKLYHFSFGKGQPVLVLHGGPGFPFREPLIKSDSLNKDFQFIYYDQRGCGKSTIPFDIFESSNYYENMKTLESTLGIGAQLADIERIRKILGEEQLIIIGHSFGGFLASLYAAEFLEHVKALILSAPADVLVFPSESDGLFEIIKEKLPQKLKAEYQNFQEEYLDFGNVFSKSENDLKELNIRFAKYYSIAAGKKFNIKDLSESGGWITQALFFSMGKEHDYKDLLKNLTVPVLVLHGENDIQPESASRLYADSFKNSQIKVIDNAGHFLFKDQPLEFEKAIRKFLVKL